ncbi:MAG: helix-turn-helix domain-containing protein [Patescibacteria group bacterium]
MIENLQALGLTKNESQIYETLIKSGSSKAGSIIAKLDIHRNVVYEALETLIRKGFVTKISKRGVWWFQITEPDSIRTMLKRREQIADEVIKEIKQYRQQVEQQITVYEGVDSYRAYWLSSLERFPEGTVDYCFGVPSHEIWTKLLGEDGVREYMDLREKKRIIWKTIHFEITDHEQELLRRYPDLTEYRLWQKGSNPIGNFNIIHDTVILQIMSNEPRIIEIRDRDMVTMFRYYFDAVWEDAVPIGPDDKP